MAQELIQSVLEAEDQAKEILRQAKEEGNRILSENQERIRTMEKETLDQAENEAKQIRQDTEDQAKSEMEDKVLQAEEEEKKISNTSEALKEKAVSRIIEEVKNYGNR